MKKTEHRRGGSRRHQSDLLSPLRGSGDVSDRVTPGSRQGLHAVAASRLICCRRFAADLRESSDSLLLNRFRATSSILRRRRHVGRRFGDRLCFRYVVRIKKRRKPSRGLCRQDRIVVKTHPSDCDSVLDRGQRDSLAIAIPVDTRIPTAATSGDGGQKRGIPSLEGQFL